MIILANTEKSKVQTKVLYEVILWDLTAMNPYMYMIVFITASDNVPQMKIRYIFSNEMSL